MWHDSVPACLVRLGRPTPAAPPNGHSTPRRARVDAASLGRQYGRIEMWHGPNHQTTGPTVGVGARSVVVAALVGSPSMPKTSYGDCRLAGEATGAGVSPTHQTGTPTAAKSTTRGTRTRTTRRGRTNETAVGAQTSRNAIPVPAKQRTHGKVQRTREEGQRTHGKVRRTREEGRRAGEKEQRTYRKEGRTHQKE
jgi:hypothetical protein